MKLRSRIFYAPEGEPSFAAGAAAILAGLPPEDGTPAPAADVKPEVALPAEVKTEIVPPADDLPEHLPNEGRSEAWKKFRGEYKTVKGELSTLKAELADFEGTRKERDELKSQIAQLEDERKKWTEIDSVVKLENSPSFRAEYVLPREKATASLKELAGYANVESSSLLSAMSKTGKDRFDALEDILSTVGTTLRGRIERTIDQIEGLDAGMAQERANADTAIKQRETKAQQAAREHQEQFTKQAQETFDSTAVRLGKELGVDDSVIQKAREFYNKNGDLSAAAERIIKSFAHDATASEKADLKKQLDEAQAELGRLKKSSPGVGAGTGVREGAGGEPKSFIAGALAALRGES